MNHERTSSEGQRESGSGALLSCSQAALAPTAQRLLEAARRLLETSGYNSLSIEAIGREAGENKSLIRYHFGSKGGLLVALVDWVVHDVVAEMRERISELPQGDLRIDAFMEGHRRMVLDAPAYKLYFDLVPHLLEDTGMRAQLSGLYATDRQLNLWALWPEERGNAPGQVAVLAAMTMALFDGLALQLLADPNSVDIDRVVSTWNAILHEHVSKAPSGTAD